jgi:hypothetical protein
MAHSDQSSFSPIENLNQSSSGRENRSRRSSHLRTRNRDVLVEYRGINTCVDTDWKIVSGVIADAELEEDAGYIEHILFMSKE